MPGDGRPHWFAPLGVQVQNAQGFRDKPQMPYAIGQCLTDMAIWYRAR